MKKLGNKLNGDGEILSAQVPQAPWFKITQIVNVYLRPYLQIGSIKSQLTYFLKTFDTLFKTILTLLWGRGG
jgi:hypothetical protein